MDEIFNLEQGRRWMRYIEESAAVVPDYCQRLQGASGRGVCRCASACASSAEAALWRRRAQDSLISW